MTRLRSLWDRATFLARAEWLYLAGVAAILLGFAPLLPSWPRWANAGIGISGFLVTAAILLHDSRALSKRFGQWILTPLDPFFEVAPSARHLEPAQLTRGTVYRSDSLDAVIDDLARDTSVICLNDGFELPSDLRAIAPYVLNKTTSSRWPFNGQALRLLSDLDPDDPQQDLYVQPVSYFDFLCSNELMRWQLSHHGVQTRPYEKHLLNSRGGLRPLGDSQLANIIGISTLAVTADGYLLLVQQTTANAASGGLLAPAGSGSLEARDFVEGANLHSLVTAGAVREMVEETGIPDGLIGETRLLGHARWLERGGKPEFFAVTKLLDLKANVSRALGRIRSGERIYTGGITWVERDRAVDSVTKGEVSPESVAFRQVASLPLAASLRSLAAADYV